MPVVYTIQLRYHKYNVIHLLNTVGLATEFMDRKTAQRVYGKNGPTSYKEIAQDFHRMRSVVAVLVWPTYSICMCY